jgi:hypothetical protein
MERSKDRLAMSHDVDALADRAAKTGQDRRAAELRDIAAHLRAKAVTGQEAAGRRPPRLLGRWRQILTRGR